MLRKTLKSAYATAISATDNPQRPNGIQVLPILWRHEITFGMASDDEEGVEMDLGMIGADDGCPTLDEVTLDGVPNIRLVVSDVLLDGKFHCTLQSLISSFPFSAIIPDSKVPRSNDIHYYTRDQSRLSIVCQKES